MTASFLPPWTEQYSYEVAPSQERSRGDNGYILQRKRSSRKVIIADVTRQLKGSQLPYFEWFVRGVLNGGQKKFTDTYYHHGGLVTGLIRIIDGKYDVTSDRRNHIITCKIEIF